MRKWWRKVIIVPAVFGLVSTVFVSQLFTNAVMAAPSDVTARPQVKEQAAYNTLELCLNGKRTQRALSDGVGPIGNDTQVPSNNNNLKLGTDIFVIGSNISDWYFPVASTGSNSVVDTFGFNSKGIDSFMTCGSSSIKAALNVYNRTNPRVILCDLGYVRTATGGGASYGALSCDAPNIVTSDSYKEEFICNDEGTYSLPGSRKHDDNRKCQYRPKGFMNDNGIVGHDSLKNGSEAAKYIYNYLSFYALASGGYCGDGARQLDSGEDITASTGFRIVDIWGFSSNNPIVERWLISDICYNQIAEYLEVDAGGNAPFLAFLDVVRPQLTADCRASNPGSRQSILECAAVSLEPVAPTEGEGATGEGEGSCIKDDSSMGWIMCPSLVGVTGAVNWVYEQIMSQFDYQVLNDNSDINNDNQSDIYAAWAIIRNIANIVFIIAFLIIIYSTAVGVGLSNYSVKKIMPRLILVAIAVNLSFYICAALVDLSNTIGANLSGFLAGAAGSPKIDVGFAAGAALLIGVIIVVLVAGGTVVLSLLMVFVLMALRDVVLTALIIISPIAFVLYLLPNTEKWAKKWLTEFSRMLFVFPMIALVWGVCMFMIGVIGNGEINTGMDFMIKAVLLIIPAVALLPIMKMGGQAMGALTNAVRKAADTTGASRAAKGVDKLGQRLGTAGFNATKRAPGIIGKTASLGERAKQWGKLKEEQEKGRAAARGRNFGSHGALLTEQFEAKEQETADQEALAASIVANPGNRSKTERDWANKVIADRAGRRIENMTNALDIAGLTNNSAARTALAMGEQQAQAAGRGDAYRTAVEALQRQGINPDALVDPSDGPNGSTYGHVLARAAMERSSILSDTETTDILDAYAGQTEFGADDTRSTGLANLVNANRGKLGWLRSDDLGAISQGGEGFGGSTETIAKNLQKLNAGEVAGAKAGQIERIVNVAEGKGAEGIEALEKLYNGIMANPTALSNMESGDAAAQWKRIRELTGHGDGGSNPSIGSGGAGASAAAGGSSSAAPTGSTAQSGPDISPDISHGTADLSRFHRGGGGDS